MNGKASKFCRRLSLGNHQLYKITKAMWKQLDHKTKGIWRKVNDASTKG